MKIGINGNWNAYVTVGSFTIAEDGRWRRRRDNFASARALMIDDIGTGKGAKVDPKIINLPPSATVETSPGNFQYWYILNPSEEKAATFDALIRAFIARKLLGHDPGMAGITRVGRLPGFPNRKPKYDGFVVQLHNLSDLRYSVSELADAFDLKLQGVHTHIPPVVTDETLRRSDAFVSFYDFLEEHKMLKQAQPDLNGWTDITCPWVEEHTGGMDNGAAIREPHAENGYHGAFRCHHGSHINKHWGDLTEWINDFSAESLERINSEASDVLPMIDEEKGKISHANRKGTCCRKRKGSSRAKAKTTSTRRP